VLPHPGSLTLWGGVECTVNRVGDQFFDQLVYSGHDSRISDLDLFARSGIKTLRYPVLWERVEREGKLDFAWADERLQRLRALDIEPIIGLVHHGSGPLHTSLLDSAFPRLLSAYAERVAERYPWVTKFTPVNEPLTTARFSALYGHWYPHARSDASFVRALLTQCTATALSMKAIRRVTPDAELIQTEDLAHCRSTEDLGYQAEFENLRRWLSLDLLCGRVDSHHPLHRYLTSNGATAKDLGFFLEEPCVPDLLGFNYYVTSERFLDSRTHLYPPQIWGGNSRVPYVDVEAVRVCAHGLLGPKFLLSAAQERYGLPMAITEAHLGCRSEEQVAWLSYIWTSAREARRHGVDVRAVTAWALLGSYGWDCLVTQGCTNYEPGVFRVEHGCPQSTPLADLVRHLAHGGAPERRSGWWLEPERLLYEGHVSKLDAQLLAALSKRAQRTASVPAQAT